jgi:hypothetical protein
MLIANSATALLKSTTPDSREREKAWLELFLVLMVLQGAALDPILVELANPLAKNYVHRRINGSTELPGSELLKLIEYSTKEITAAHRSTNERQRSDFNRQLGDQQVQLQALTSERDDLKLRIAELTNSWVSERKAAVEDSQLQLLRTVSRLLQRQEAIAASTGDLGLSSRIRNEVRASAASLGLIQLGRPGAMTDYDPAWQAPVEGSNVDASHKVVIVSTGYAWPSADGSQRVVASAIVRTHST